MIVTHSEDKKKALLHLVEKHGFSLKGSVGVGDTESDIGIFELVEEPICFNPTANLVKVARQRNWKIVVERKDAIYEIQNDKLI